MTIQERVMKFSCGRLICIFICITLAALLTGAAGSALTPGSQLRALAGTHEEEELSFAGEQGVTCLEARRGSRMVSVEIPGVTKAIFTLTTTAAGAGIFALWLLIAIWLYQEASKADMNRLLWPILSIIMPPAGLLLFLILREQKKLKCKNCGKWQEEANYCRQ